MKLLMIFTTRFAYIPGTKTIPDMPDADAASFSDSLAGFVHVEEQDRGREGKVMTRLVKNLKWLAGKNGTRRIILHSFSHLAESKADPLYAREFLDRAQARLESAGYEVHQTPYGYFLDLDLRAPGHPLARVFKDL